MRLAKLGQEPARARERGGTDRFETAVNPSNWWVWVAMASSMMWIRAVPCVVGTENLARWRLGRKTSPSSRNHRVPTGQRRRRVRARPRHISRVLCAQPIPAELNCEVASTPANVVHMSASFAAFSKRTPAPRQRLWPRE